MTTLTIEETNTRPPMQPIRTSSPIEFVYESSSTDESAELWRDMEAAEATLLKYRKLDRAAFDPSVEEQPPERYISADEYPLLAELWDNDADAVYDEM